MSVDVSFRPLVHELAGACVTLMPVGLHDVFALLEV